VYDNEYMGRYVLQWSALSTDPLTHWLIDWVTYGRTDKRTDLFDSLCNYPLKNNPNLSNFNLKLAVNFILCRICGSHELCLLPASVWFLAWLILRLWRWRHVPPKRLLTFNGLHGIISQNIKILFQTILVNVNRNKYPVVRPTWALKPGLTDLLVVGHNVTLTLTC
jgi:hypothetical protein